MSEFGSQHRSKVLNAKLRALFSTAKSTLFIWKLFFNSSISFKSRKCNFKTESLRLIHCEVLPLPIHKTRTLGAPLTVFWRFWREREREREREQFLLSCPITPLFSKTQSVNCNDTVYSSILIVVSVYGYPSFPEKDILNYTCHLVFDLIITISFSGWSIIQIQVASS
jgi:hypothetical protein